MGLRFAPLLFLLACAGLFFASGIPKRITFAEIVERRDDLRLFVEAHYAKALLIYLGAYIGIVALSLPGAVALTVMGGFLFGWLIGGACAIVGATIGAVLVFLAARTSLGALLAAKAGPRLSRLLGGFREDAASYLLFLRLVPIFPFWLVNLAPALAGVGLGTYALTTIVGIVPGTFAFAIAGAGLDSAIAAQKAVYQACLAAGETGCRIKFHAKMVITPGLMAAFAALGVVALIPVFAKFYARRSGRRMAGFERDSEQA